MQHKKQTSSFMPRRTTTTGAFGAACAHAGRPELAAALRTFAGAYWNRVT